MTTKSANTFVPRVTQLDAVTLDKEINNVLKSQIVNIFQIAHLSVLRNHATFGQQLLGIKYSNDSRGKVCAFAVLLVGGKYIADRSHTLFSATGNQHISSQISRVLHWCRVSVQALSLINTALFLGEGRFPTLADRLLGLQPVPAFANLSRSVGYTYMTRELLWHGFIELLVFVLPLINYQALSSRVKSLFLRRNENIRRDDSPLQLNLHSLCAVCSQPPILPHHISCTHVFCAYCIEANLLADTKFECPLCGAPALGRSRPVQL